MAVSRVHIWVSGRVQGVFFRYHTRMKARELGLAGYVRNLADGRVEIVAEGEKNHLVDLVSWAHRGPSGSQVRDVEFEWEKPEQFQSSFEITW